MKLHNKASPELKSNHFINLLNKSILKIKINYELLINTYKL